MSGVSLSCCSPLNINPLKCKNYTHHKVQTDTHRCGLPPPSFSYIRTKTLAQQLSLCKKTPLILKRPVKANSRGKRQAVCWLRYYFRSGLDFERSAIFTSSSTLLAYPANNELPCAEWFIDWHFYRTRVTCLKLFSTKRSSWTES